MAMRGLSICGAAIASLGLLGGCSPAETVIIGGIVLGVTSGALSDGVDSTIVDDGAGGGDAVGGTLAGAWSGSISANAFVNGFPVESEPVDLTLAFNDSGLPIDNLAMLYALAADLLTGDCDPETDATGTFDLNEPGIQTIVACTDASSTDSSVVFTVSPESDSAAGVLVVDFAFDETGTCTNAGSGVITLTYALNEQGLTVRAEVDTTRDVACPSVSSVRSFGFTQWFGVLAR